MATYKRSCIMGCPIKTGQQLHVFPSDPKRRAEWCRILGIYPRVKKVNICVNHFSSNQLFGNRLHRFALPNPPEARNRCPITKVSLSVGNNSKQDDSSSAQDDSVEEFPLPNPSEARNRCPITKKTSFSSSVGNNNEQGDIISAQDDLVEEFPDQEPLEEENDLEITQEVEDEENDLEITQEVDDEENDLEITQEEEEVTTIPPVTPEPITNVEEFEIRKGSTNDMIIKGRYVQTNDYLVFSYTPPRKWSLQQQIKMLDSKCKEYKRTTEQLISQNTILRRERKKHEKLLPEFRKLVAKNRQLYIRLQRYKYKVKVMKEREKKAKR